MKPLGIRPNHNTHDRSPHLISVPEASSQCDNRSPMTVHLPHAGARTHAARLAHPGKSPAFALHPHCRKAAPPRHRAGNPIGKRQSQCRPAVPLMGSPHRRHAGARRMGWTVQQSMARPAAHLSSPDKRQYLKQHNWWSVQTSAAVKALPPLLDASDAAWVLTLALEHHQARRAFARYIDGLPDAAILNWLPTPLHNSHGPSRLRLANMVRRRTTLPNHPALMHALTTNGDHPTAATQPG